MTDQIRPKRGLSALLAATSPGTESKEVLASSFSSGDVSISSIRANPDQPRTNFDPQALAELSASIKARGVIQPVVLRQLRPEEISGETQYELIAGERRWRASQMAGLATIPAIIKNVFDNRDVLLLSLVENLQRDDLNPIEEALAYDRLSKTFNLTHDQIAEGVGKNRATVSNTIRLLDLPVSVQEAIKLRRLNVGHAKVLLGIPDQKIQAQLAAKVQAEGLTVRELERIVAGSSHSNAQLPPTRATTQGRVVPPNIQEIERRLREHFGTRVSVEEGLHRGRIVIEFYSTEDFERIISLMKVEP